MFPFIKIGSLVLSVRINMIYFYLLHTYTVTKLKNVNYFEIIRGMVPVGIQLYKKKASEFYIAVKFMGYHKDYQYVYVSEIAGYDCGTASFQHVQRNSLKF